MMRGIQTDQYNEVMSGHKAVLDPLQTGTTDVTVTGDVLPNLIVGGSDAVVSLPFALAPKGLALTAGPGEQLLLPESFDLATLGADASIVLSVWFTQDSIINDAYQALAGCGRQTGDDSQWYISTLPDGTDGAVDGMRFAINSNNILVNQVINQPRLLTAVIKKSGGVAQVEFYVDGSLQETQDLFVYALRSGTANPSSTRHVGAMSGFGGAFLGVFHRASVAVVDVDTFDFAGYVAAEYANNVARFTE
jgi:hypothetical protein